MVTVWHRIRKGVSGIGDTEWALLAFETIGIVFGVLFAVQVGNWIEDARETREQRELVERLFEESQMSIALVRGQMAFLDAPRERQVKALDQLVNQDACPDRSGWGALAVTQFSPGLSPPSTAYDEMVGSGGLGRLKDPAVRNAVSSFHGSLAEFQRQQDFFRSSVFTQSELFDANFPLSFDPETMEVGIGDTGYEALCSEPDIETFMLTAFRTSRVMSGYRQGLLEDAIRMCVLLGDQVGQVCEPADRTPLTEEEIAEARGEGAAD